MCAARVWPRTPMTASRSLDDAPVERRVATVDRRLVAASRRGAAALLRGPSASCGRPTRVTGMDWSARIVGWPEAVRVPEEKWWVRFRDECPTGGAPWRRGRGRGDRGPAGRRRCGRRRRARRPRAHAPSRHRFARQGPAHRGRPRAGGPGARDGGPFAGRAGQAASLRGGHGAQPGRDDGREERPGPQPVPPAGGHRGGRVPGHRRAAPRGAGDGRRRAGPAAGG